MIDLGHIDAESPLLDEETKNGIQTVLDKITDQVVIKAVIDQTQDKCMEMAVFLKSFCKLSEHLSLELYEPKEAVPELNTKYLPVTGFYKAGSFSGMSFHGIPGGQEINAFILGLYNLAGSGQEISRWTVKKIEKISKPVNIKICVSLFCHHCPKVVAVCQKMASLNPNIQAEMIDASLYPDLIEQYKIERVPMILINDKEQYMGEKTIEEMADIIKKVTK